MMPTTRRDYRDYDDGGAGAWSRHSRLVEMARASQTAFPAGSTICNFGETAYVCEVVEGMARLAWVTGEGRRVVSGFFTRGEVFGVAPRSASAAEAVCESVVALCERRALEARALTDARVARQLWAWLNEEAERTAARLSLLAYGSAVEKISHFLLEMADRLGGEPRMVLPMSRYDIADYLGLSSETVSRTFTVLRVRGLVATEGRSVALLRRDTLRRYGEARA
jgi:CRP-like cAMP-binding protein